MSELIDLMTDKLTRQKTMELTIRVSAKDWVACEEIAPPDGVSIRGPIPVERYQLDDIVGAVLGFIINIANQVPVDTIVEWLYEKFHQHGAKHITIETKTIDLDRGEIKRIVLEKIEVRH